MRNEIEWALWNCLREALPTLLKANITFFPTVRGMLERFPGLLEWEKSVKWDQDYASESSSPQMRWPETKITWRVHINNLYNKRNSVRRTDCLVCPSHPLFPCCVLFRCPLFSFLDSGFGTSDLWPSMTTFDNSDLWTQTRYHTQRRKKTCSW